MKKIGPIIAIIAGLYIIVMAVLNMLAVGGHIHSDHFLVAKDKGTKDTAKYIGLIITLLIGAAEMALGVYSMKNAGGKAAIALIILFAISFVLALINGATNHHFPTSSIIQLVISGVALIGLVIGYRSTKQSN